MNSRRQSPHNAEGAVRRAPLERCRDHLRAESRRAPDPPDPHRKSTLLFVTDAVTSGARLGRTVWTTTTDGITVEFRNPRVVSVGRGRLSRRS